MEELGKKSMVKSNDPMTLALGNISDREGQDRTFIPPGTNILFGSSTAKKILEII